MPRKPRRCRVAATAARPRARSEGRAGSAAIRGRATPSNASKVRTNSRYALPVASGEPVDLPGGPLRLTPKRDGCPIGVQVG